MSQLEPPGLPHRRTGERTFLVAEELGFEQVLGNGRAVDGDKGSVGARAERVQRAREELFAGAALTLEKHARVGGRRTVERQGYLLEPRVFADNLRRAAPL